jgi:hypothetical protein
MDDPKAPQEAGTSAEAANLSDNDLDQVAGGKPATQAPVKYMTYNMTEVLITNVSTSDSK